MIEVGLMTSPDNGILNPEHAVYALPPDRAAKLEERAADPNDPGDYAPETANPTVDAPALD
jgi:hypothetical protein